MKGFDKMNREEYSFIIEFDEITHEQMTYITDFLYDTGIKYQLLKSDYELKKQETLEQALDEVEKEYLSSVIKPFKNVIIGVEKHVFSEKEEYIYYYI